MDRYSLWLTSEDVDWSLRGQLKSTVKITTGLTRQFEVGDCHYLFQSQIRHPGNSQQHQLRARTIPTGMTVRVCQ